MDPVTFTGGCRVGESYWSSSNYSIPLATLVIQEDRVGLQMPFKTISLSRDQIIGFKDYRGIISDGVQILHSANTVPPFVVVWISPGKIAERLRQFQYPYGQSTSQSRAQRRRPFMIACAFITPLLFLLLLTDGYLEKKDFADAILNACAGTIFIAVACIVIGRRILR